MEVQQIHLIYSMYHFHDFFENIPAKYKTITSFAISEGCNVIKPKSIQL